MLSKRWSRVFGDQSGNVALVFALSGFAMVGMVGGGIEITRVVDGKAKLQSALDAGALAAAGMPDGSVASLREVTANKVTAANLQVGRGIVANSLVVTPDFTVADRVTLAGEIKIETILGQSMFGGFHTIKAISTAQKATPAVPAVSPPPPPICPAQPDPVISPPQISPPPPAPLPPPPPPPTTSANGCVWALNANNDKGTLQFKKDNNILAPRCHFFAHSSDSKSVDVDKDNLLTFDALFTKGGLDCKNGCPSTFVAYAGTRAAADPYANGLPQLTAGTCVATSGKYTSSATLTPGTYCSDMDFKGSSSILTLQPGVYHIKGDWKVDASIITGSGVTLYFDDDAKWDVKDDTLISMTAPTTGATAGLLMYEKYGAKSGKLTIGNGTFTLTGIMYFPSKSIEFKSKSSASVLSAQIIGYEVSFDKTTMNYRPYDGPRPPFAGLPPPVPPPPPPPVSTGSGLLTNGSAEEPVSAPNATSIRTIAQGMLGWSTSRQFEIHNSATWPGGGGFGTDGVQYAELEKDLSQTIVLQAGVTYRLNFDYRYGDNGTSADNRFIINWGNQQLADIQPVIAPGGAQWKRMTFPIKGTGDPVTFTFAQMLGANFDHGPFIDRVRIESDGTLTAPPDGCPGGGPLPPPPPPKAAIPAIPLRLVK